MLSLAPLHELQELATALRQADLPTGDLDAAGRRFFRAAEAGGGVIGYGGFEGSGNDQLLRSVVIAPASRGRGHGRALVDALLAQARNDGAARVWLMTTDAMDFFRHLGFADAAREAAPSVVTQSLQFTTLCPASAKLLVKDI
ncbi:arsenic resistance N-acetyltransferase ArsN2 [Dongia rigui]|uniref:Arsenic resistance N-acetyltransferase ArsN2 n=1 Tax=Dongia rigui TaxID=940149 RepID=A0ABU5DVH6_9PROT|nr:arsenic resistance N-acetyltransferase ArsN2 [Dongia rigui]MDY0871287.1 arsenic resistance N-acetyltransferase ArsN2 [Dongia rigui]